MFKTLAAVLMLSTVAFAQQPPPKLETLSGGMLSLYRSIRANILEAAELMPESEYGFKPTADVRTFGQLVGHLANTQYNFCAPALGVPNPVRINNETLDKKDALVKALKDAVAFCDPAYERMTDAELGASTTFGPARITKGYALTYNVAHDNEHYGNMVTYLRLKGLVPPSTARRGGG